MDFPKQLKEVSRLLFADLNTPVSLGAWLRVKYEEWDQLAAMAIDPFHYLDTCTGASRFSKDAAAVNFLRKSPLLPIKDGGKLRASRALEIFHQCEKQCAETNLRMKPYLSNWGLTSAMGGIRAYIELMQKRVENILGPIPTDLVPRFGKGATFESKELRLSGRGLCLGDKISNRLTLTRSAGDLSCFIYKSAWGRALLERDKSGPSYVPGNRFTTVAKTALVDRGICVEPGGNIALQLHIGRHIRKRLLQVGIDLKNGQSLHQRLARDGSFSDEIATLDLSNASDTVSRAVVKLLLPEEWHDLLDVLRSPKTSVNGQWHTLEKFSSMGNGFTFELETLIFGVITEVLSGGLLGANVFVYGDDILCPAEAFNEVKAGLIFFGFTPNVKKSFSNGPFRESCGGDFFFGYPVRSYYVDGEDLSTPLDWISLYNGLQRVQRNLPAGVTWRAKRAVAGFIPSEFRLYGPRIFGDIVLHNHESRWTTRTRNCIREVKALKIIPKRVPLARFPSEVQLAIVLYGGAASCSGSITDTNTPYEWGPSGLCFRDTRGFLTPRATDVSGFKASWVCYS